MKNYSGAKDIFLTLTSGGDVQNNSAFYNLGAAYMGLERYEPAIEAFQRALSFDPNDVDSTFQMGICFSRLGDAAQVRNFYLALQEKDSARAEQFRKIVGKSFNLDSAASFQIEEPAAPPAAVSHAGSGTGGGNY